MIKKLFYSFLTGIFFLQPAIIQAQETPDSVRYKTLGCIYHAIDDVNKRNGRLQGLQHELEAMEPLAPQNMDSAHFVQNLESVGRYLRFLVSHRKELTIGTRRFIDSLRMFQPLLLAKDEKEAIEKFITAYKEEAAAFMLYSERLSLLVTEIRSALEFLKTVPMERKGGEIVFDTDRSANEKYLDYESKISSMQFQVDEAIQKTVKQSEKENKAIHETMQVLNR